ncbi:hypothetical protein [Streptomyces griseoluteus]|uniref:hypothetical protein n=1 Tax=Streptomyces griseoluteus TaxID=29306 RepID=UPI0038207CB6
MRGSRAAALLAGLVAAVTLAGCGVPTSGVIQAGPPASGMPAVQPPRRYQVSLYFLGNGTMPQPYVHEVAATDGSLVRNVLSALFDGPSADESGTAGTDLPRVDRTPEVQTEDNGRTTVIQFPKGVAALNHMAMLQLACTVGGLRPGGFTVTGTETGAESAAPDTSRNALAETSVRVTGDGWTMTQSSTPCPAVPHN